MNKEREVALEEQSPHDENFEDDAIALPQLDPFLSNRTSHNSDGQEGIMRQTLKGDIAAELHPAKQFPVKANPYPGRQLLLGIAQILLKACTHGVVLLFLLRRDPLFHEQPFR